jgi:hypothetical protein
MRSFKYFTENCGLSSAMPNIIKGALVILFAILWAIWIQPHTIALRHMLLSIGSILGMYVISKNLNLFKTKSSVPIYLICLLFAWVTFHLFFLSHQYELQLEEFLTIWKRVAWGAPFAIGLGISMQGMRVGNEFHLKSKNNKVQFGANYYWWIFYSGMCMPTLIYLVRVTSMYLAGEFGWVLPNGLLIFPPSSTWFVPKTGYVFFCLPALALACNRLIDELSRGSRGLTWPPMIYTSTIAAVVAIFYFENIKNGVAYSALLILIMAAKVIVSKKSRFSWRNTLIMLVGLVALTFLLTQHFQKNDSWGSLFADVKVAENLDEVDSWKFYGGKGYPTNELGKLVSETNYMRAAWSQVAVRFISEMPFGYGLVKESFGKMAEEKWPSSTLLQSHSGWLDLFLGIGIPGGFLLILAGAISLRNALQADRQSWGGISFWILLSIALLMITTEVSQKTYIDALAFLILWTAGLGLHSNGHNSVFNPT